jgi:hypothetical protein
MTNLNKLIERQQGEVEKWKMFPEKEYIDIINYDQYQVEDVKNEVAEVATEAYRQALEDVLAGLPEPSNPRGPWESGSSDGYNTALQTVRAQIEVLLGKINEV